MRVKNQSGNTITIVAIIIVLVFVLGVAVFLYMGESDESNYELAVQESSQPNEDQVIEIDPDSEEPLPSGAYVDYSESAVADAGDSKKVIFFHAEWCPECRSFEQNLLSAPIPDGLTILKADYDTESALKQKHGITHQTSFVQVDSDGDQLTKWQGFGRDDVNTVLENVVEER